MLNRRHLAALPWPDSSPRRAGVATRSRPPPPPARPRRRRMTRRPRIAHPRDATPTATRRRAIADRHVRRRPDRRCRRRGTDRPDRLRRPGRSRPLPGAGGGRLDERAGQRGHGGLDGLNRPVQLIRTSQGHYPPCPGRRTARRRHLGGLRRASRYRHGRPERTRRGPGHDRGIGDRTGRRVPTVGDDRHRRDRGRGRAARGCGRGDRRPVVRITIKGAALPGEPDPSGVSFRSSWRRHAAAGQAVEEEPRDVADRGGGGGPDGNRWSSLRTARS